MPGKRGGVERPQTQHTRWKTHKAREPGGGGWQESTRPAGRPSHPGRILLDKYSLRINFRGNRMTFSSPFFSIAFLFFFPSFFREDTIDVIFEPRQLGGNIWGCFSSARQEVIFSSFPFEAHRKFFLFLYCCLPLPASYSVMFSYINNNHLHLHKHR